MSTALKAIESELDAALAQVDEFLERDEPVPGELVAEAERMTLAAEEKRDAVAFALRRDERLAEMIGKEIARLAALEARVNRRRDWLCNVILKVMRSRGIKSLPGAMSRFTAIQNPPHVEVGAPQALPERFLRTVPERVEPDKAAIGWALRKGEDVPGARLVDGEWRLRIS